jgi:hypothetical protein
MFVIVEIMATARGSARLTVAAPGGGDGGAGSSRTLESTACDLSIKFSIAAFHTLLPVLPSYLPACRATRPLIM